MKKLMKVETNATTMFVSYDAAEKVVRVLDNEETNSGFDFRNVEDDSSWDMYENIDDIDSFLGINETPDSPVITDTIILSINEIEIYTDEEKAFIHNHHLLSLDMDEEPKSIYWQLLYLMAHYRTLAYYRQFPADTIVEPIAQSSWCDLTCTVSDKIKELVDDITEFEERGYLYA